MAGIATPVRPTGKGVERDGRADGGTAWVKGQEPPTADELTAAGVVFDIEIEPVSGSAANRYAGDCAEAYADPEEAGPQSLEDFPAGTIHVGGNSMMFLSEDSIPSEATPRHQRRGKKRRYPSGPEKPTIHIVC